MRDAKRVVVAGGAGFMGTALVPELVRRGYEVVVLTRGQARNAGPVRYVNWDGRNPGVWGKEVDGSHAVVNLVGRTVDCRKTAANRKVILESRVDSVRALAAAIATAARPPDVWVQSGTAHIFGDTDDEVLDESSPTGDGFAPDVGRAWEAALGEAPLPPSVRRVVLRVSFVLGRSGGALATLARLARLGLGGTIGTGRQWMSWIHMADLVAIMTQAIEDDRMTGTYVVTAPHPVTNAEFMTELRRAVGRSFGLPAPEALVRLGSVILRTDPELALLGRRCVPTRLMREGFTFQFPQLRPALLDLLHDPAPASAGVAVRT